MSNIRQYWQAVRAIEATLPEFVWLVDAIENKDVVVVTQVAADVAAKLIHAKTHRVATQDEVDAHRDREATANKNARRERLGRAGSAVVSVEENATEDQPKRRSR
jgi:hypothetical protein